MATPYAALKSAIQALEKAHTKLTDARYLADDRKATMRDLRLIFEYEGLIRGAVGDLRGALMRFERLRTPPAGKEA